MRLRRALVAAGACMWLLCAWSAWAQICYAPEHQMLVGPEPPTTTNPQFGARVALEGDLSLVSAPSASLFGQSAGAVYAVERLKQGDGETQWVITQTLGAGLVGQGDYFGQALALDGSGSGAVAVVGAPRDDPGPGFSTGSVHVFRRFGDKWLHLQQLIASDASGGDRFGASVDVSGDAIIVGAPGDDEGGSDAGAAYVFRFQGGAWIEQQKIMETPAGSLRRFGSAVIVDGDLAFMTRDPAVAGAGSEQVLRYRRQSPEVWAFIQAIPSPDGVWGDDFGASLSYARGVGGGTLVVGAPTHDPGGGIDAGAAYVFIENAVMFSFDQKLTHSFPLMDDRFGTSVGVFGDVLVVGTPHRDIQPFPLEGSANDAGAVIIFHRDARAWTEHHTARAGPRYVWGWNDDRNDEDDLGTSLALWQDEILAGALVDEFEFSDIAGKVLFFSAHGVDCDADGTPDSCEADCNHNDVGDECEILGGTEGDCNINGVLDVCENGFDYAIDSGFTAGAWGPTSQTIEYVWINQFFAQEHTQTLTHVAVAWLAYGPAGHPGEIVVYDDPNNDGHPADAVLLASHPVTLLADVSITGQLHTAYRITPTNVGKPGESFFLGVHMTLPAQTFVALADGSPTPGHSNWRVAALPGTDFGTLSGWNINPLNGDWRVRAASLDCNGNGTWDDCDIANGVSLDLNSNGIPDECERDLCVADVAGNDGMVNIDDLLAVISAWGPCPAPPAACPANIVISGASATAVDIEDLLAVISAWGPCL